MEGQSPVRLCSPVAEPPLAFSVDAILILRDRSVLSVRTKHFSCVAVAPSLKARGGGQGKIVGTRAGNVLLSSPVGFGMPENNV